ncbi:C2H2-type zinc finger protein [Medicago truncatula]|uniref:C2H2-type zinc finger protein n=1 Tax=Medicago truncatula TaxID=3880 RepID=G7JHH2_MEDTR|nr:C2H2-type zinc finger protein [Medicago truncatula]
MEEKHRKFVCKYCFKRFPCGKSLGGHIRTHMTEERNNAAAIAAAGGDAAEHVAAGVGDGGNLIYGLRENPKKTMRFVHSHHHHYNHHAATAAATTLEQNEMIKFCKECGKGFPSLKALCGHMASHSEKEKKINKAMMEEDTQSDDTDDDDDDVCVAATTMNLRKSKRRIRFKSITLSNQQPSSSSVNGGSSSVSEMEQEQQEEGRFVSESSDNNNEIVLETKSKIVIRNGNKFVANHAREFVAEKKKKLKMVGIGVSNNSDLRDFRYGSKKIKFVDSSVPNYEFKRPKVEADKSGFDDCRSKYNNNVTTIFKKSGMMNKDLDHDTKFDSRKKDNDISYDSTTDVESDEENSSESDSFPAAKSHNSKAVNRKKLSSSNKGKKKKKLKSKKSKEYECPICYKIFRSGQALGGHKRSHFVGGSEENTFVIKQAAAAVAVPCLIDLNLPAPVDE